ncbi:MAG: ABC transporter substrate-binding protein [Alphaproteobacteria bacterium]
MRRLSLYAVVIAACLAFNPDANAASPVASKVVESLHASLLGVMKNADALGFEGRRERLAPVIAEAFDMALIARGSTGPHWKSFDGDEKERLVEMMRALTVAAYAARFDGYSGEICRVLSQSPGPRGTVLVNAELVKSDGETIEINYLLRPSDAGWRIVDVYLGGVYSELALRRSEYTAVIKRKGLDGLFATIEERIAAYEAEPPE